MKIFFNPRRRQDGGIWLIAFVVIGTAVVAGVVVWMMHHWKVKMDEYQKRREQAATNEAAQLYAPPGVTNVVIIDKKHWWEFDTNDTASVVSLLEEDNLTGSSLLVTSPVGEARILHPVLTIGLSNNVLVFLLLTNDGLWSTSSVPMVDKYGAPNPDLESGPPPVCDAYFSLERTVDLKVWKEVIRMGVSSNNPSMFRDVDVGWGDPHVFYRTRQD